MGRKVDIKERNDEILEVMQGKGYKLVKGYVNSSTKIEYICLKHDHIVQSISYCNFKKGQGCRYCNFDKLSKDRRKYDSIEPVRAIFENKGCTLLSDTYINMDSPLEYICENGHKGAVTLYNFINDNYCNVCKYINRRGENHHNWRGGITPKSEKIRKSNRYIEWRDSVYERDNHTCQCCMARGVYLHAHHINNFSNNEEIRLDINNGITLCNLCHNTGEASFHTVYGRSDNNSEQLIEYILSRRIEMGLSEYPLPLVLTNSSFLNKYIK